MDMKMKLIVLIGCLTLGFGAYGFAEDSTDATASNVQDRIAYLRQLREENPEAFQDALKQHREQVRQRLEKLREENPDKFREVVENRRGRFRDRLERLRTEHPDQFKQLVENRRKRLEERAEYVKTHHPEKYEQFMQRRTERLSDIKKRNPEQFKQFLENHPRVRERFEQHQNWRNRAGDHRPRNHKWGPARRGGIKREER